MAELLLSCRDLTLAFDARPIFEDLAFGISEGDRVGLVGPNGSGKSSLLRILSGREAPSSGSASARRRLRLGYVQQSPDFAPGETVRSALEAAVAGEGLEEHVAATRVAVAQSRAGFEDGDQPCAELSGGWRKRLAIARELARNPELLLLDEPTNHLDLDGILWLEELLRRTGEAFLAVSHDRYFLEAVATRLIDLDSIYPSGLLDVDGGYRRYLERKDELLAGQAAYQSSLRNRVRGELEWLSRKARARTRKAQARVDEAGRLAGELRELDERTRSESIGIDFAGTGRETRRLLVAEGLSRTLGGRTLIRDLDLVLSPGTRLGLLGANGTGKTTLLRLLAGLDAPDAGSVEHAPELRVVYFDQTRSQLDLELSLKRNLAPAGGDSVVVGGRAVHVAGWASRFLFRGEQLETPVGQLSGGEQARVALAKLMLEPADLLLMDEPTNDLDIPTLEVLEESLLEFPGALVLVTHDRHLLDRVSTRLLALDGKGGVVAYADYPQWERAQKPALEPARRGAGAARTQDRRPGRPTKLSYNEQREWDGMEGRILEAEARLEECETQARDPAVATDHVELSRRLEELDRAQRTVEQLYARWAELEARLHPADG
jgi:ATP-binding cassette subfamily F protein uup